VLLGSRDEVTGEWRKLHNEELHDLYSSSNIERGIKIENEMGGTCTTDGKERDVYRVLDLVWTCSKTGRRKVTKRSNEMASTWKKKTRKT
jgi:hypothetical protein